MVKTDRSWEVEVRRYGADRTRRLKAWGSLKYKNLAINLPPLKEAIT